MSKSKSKASESISEQVREAVRASGLTYYEIETKTQVNHAVLSRFMTATRSITLDTLDRLAAALKIRIARR